MRRSGYWKLSERALTFEEAFPRVTTVDGVTSIDLARIVARLRGAQRLRLERELPGCEWLSAQHAGGSLDLDQFHDHLATCGICLAIPAVSGGQGGHPAVRGVVAPRAGAGSGRQLSGAGLVRKLRWN